MTTTRNPDSSGRRGPGRPAGDPELREQLLNVALDAFSEHGFNGASVSAIARAAGATPAMIHYYFGTKTRLYQAVLSRAFEPLLSRLAAATADAPDDEDLLPHFVRGYMRVLAEFPQVPSLVVRDVLSPHGRMREVFVQVFASRGGTGIRELVSRARRHGRLRPDLDLNLATLSLLSMTVFPFLGAPVASQVLDYSLDPGQIDQLADHTIELFYRGAGA